MSRRRPTEADTQFAEDALPPPGTADLANSKRRSTTEKATKFFRTRPVTSLLLFFAFILSALLTFTIGRTVGKTIFSAIRTPKKPPPTLSDDAPRGAVDHSLLTGKDKVGLANEENGDDDGDDDKVAIDEMGALVDGADNTEGIPVSANVAGGGLQAEIRSPDHAKTCHRKFEPGKLGSPKMLCVTDEFFFDISIGTVAIGTIKIGVFGDVVPKSAANFRALATCTGVFADDSLCYKGDSFHRVVTNFVVQGGSKATGRSIYGPTFKEEKEKDHHSFLKHSENGVVSWAEYPIGSQFFILIRDEAVYLDDNHVVFGIVTEGMDVLDKMHDTPRTGEEPKSRISITNCGDVRKQS